MSLSLRTAQPTATMDESELLQQARFNMVESQLRPNRVVDETILNAFRNTPRELFVDPRDALCAYVDTHLSLGDGRYVLEPMVLGRMIQELAPHHHEHVAVVAAGRGYSAAVLAQICSHVTAIESVATLVTGGSLMTQRLCADVVRWVKSPIHAPKLVDANYHAIIIDGGAVQQHHESVAQKLLRVGGRMVAAVITEVSGSLPPVATITLFEKVDEQGPLAHRPLFESVLPSLPEFAFPASFKL